MQILSACMHTVIKVATVYTKGVGKMVSGGHCCLSVHTACGERGLHHQCMDIKQLMLYSAFPIMQIPELTCRPTDLKPPVTPLVGR